MGLFLNPRSYVQPLFGALGRRLLRGAPGEAIGRAMQAPVAGLGGEFDINPLTGLSPPPGQVGNAPVQRGLFPMEQGSGQVPPTGGGLTASPPTAPPPPAAAPAGDIPLADLLSHGVEQSPAPGLSAGPMGSPEPQGVPFQRNAAHEAGKFRVSPEDWLNNFLKGENNSDYAGVKSQGVPEGIVQRVARGGTDQGSIGSVSPEFANAQAADRVTGVKRSILDPDGRATPISGVAARDVGIQGSSAGVTSR